VIDPDPLRRWWIADVIDRVGWLYGRGIGGRETRRIKVNGCAETARDIRVGVLLSVYDQLPQDPKYARHIATIERGWQWDWKRIVGVDEWPATSQPPTVFDLDLWEWAFFRLEWLEMVWAACGWRAPQLLLDGLCPIDEPPQIRIRFLISRI